MGRYLDVIRDRPRLQVERPEAVAVTPPKRLMVSVEECDDIRRVRGELAAALSETLAILADWRHVRRPLLEDAARSLAAAGDVVLDEAASTDDAARKRELIDHARWLAERIVAHTRDEVRPRSWSGGPTF